MALHNATSGCIGVTCRFTSMTVVQMSGPVAIPSGLAGFPGLPWDLPPDTSEQGELQLSFPMNAPAGTYSFEVTFSGINLANGNPVTEKTTARVDVVGPFRIEEVNGNCAFNPGTVAELRFRIVNHTSVARAVDWVVTSKQTSSSNTADHYPIAEQGVTLLPRGEPLSTTVPTITGTANLPAFVGGAVEVVVDTRSYAKCHACSNNEYEMVGTDQATLNQASALSNYTVLTPGWGGDVPIKPGCVDDIVNYCTAGTSASGCTAVMDAAGIPSATASTGFLVFVTDFEGAKNGIFFFGVIGSQANAWGNGTSYQCVVPPLSRAGLLPATGTPNSCDGFLSQDLNALWCPGCPKPSKNPGSGTRVYTQLWYRDPLNTSNQTTSLSDGLAFTVCQ